MGPTASEVLSPTPPVECLSTTRRPRAAPRSSVSPGADHRVGQCLRLAAGETLEVDSHAPGGHLVVGHVTSRVAEDEVRDLAVGELLAVALPFDQIGGAAHAFRVRGGRSRAVIQLDEAAGKALSRRLPPEPGVHRGAHIGELALLVDPPRCVAPGCIRKEQGVLARVVGRRCRRIAAVVGGEDQQVARMQRLEDVRESTVEVLETAVEVHRVVPVAPEHVRLHEVDEHEATFDRLEELDRPVDAVDVGLRREGLVDVTAGEDVADLPHAVDGVARVADRREIVRPTGLEREVVPIGRPLVVPRFARERPRDHTPDCVPTGEDPPRDPAAVVELLERDRLLMGRDLEDGVGRRVDDPLARALVLFAELLDDLGTRRGLVTKHAPPGLIHERVDDLVGKAVRVRRERRRRDDAHVLPVAGCGVLAFGALEEPAGDSWCARLRRAALEREDVPEAERLEIGQVEASDGAGHVAERVGAFVSVLRRVRQLTRADGIEHDHARPRHAGILRRLWTTPSAYSCSWSTSPRSSRSRLV